MDNVYENIIDYNPNRKRKILIVFEDTIQALSDSLTFLFHKMSGQIQLVI